MIKQIRVGPQTFDVIMKSEIKKGDDSNFTARVIFDQSEMWVLKGMDAFSTCQSEWHEIVHIILAHAKIKKHNERLVEVMANGIMQVLKDNPEFVKESMNA